MKTTDSINELAQQLDADVTNSMQTLSTRLRRVEKELDLECSNLRDLVNSKDPEINRQLDSLSKSISELHESLSDVRSRLDHAQAEGRELVDALPKSSSAKQTETTPNDKVDLTPEEIGRMRHDEEITLSGIFRALFMADEPEQRNNSK